jgi:hypothetical protein
MHDTIAGPFMRVPVSRYSLNTAVPLLLVSRNQRNEDRRHARGALKPPGKRKIITNSQSVARYRPDSMDRFELFGRLDLSRSLKQAFHCTNAKPNAYDRAEREIERAGIEHGLQSIAHLNCPLTVNPLKHTTDDCIRDFRLPAAHSILTCAARITSLHLADSLRKYSANASSGPGTGCTA